MNCFFETHKFAPEMNRMYIKPAQGPAVVVRGFTPQVHSAHGAMMTRYLHKGLTRQYRRWTRRRADLLHCHIVNYTFTLTTKDGESASIDGQSRAHSTLRECLAEIEARAPQGQETELHTKDGFKPATGKRVLTRARVFIRQNKKGD